MSSFNISNKYFYIDICTIWQIFGICTNTNNKYYNKDGEAFFNPFHSGQWCIFLYYLSNTIFKSNNENKSRIDYIVFIMILGIVIISIILL